MGAVITILRFLGAGPAFGAWFFMARPEAALELRGEDAQTRQQAGQVAVARRERLLRQRLRLDTRGHVYDERLLGYSLGLGVDLAQSRAEGPARDAARSLDDEYQAQLSLLPNHALSGAASFERAHSTAHNAFAGRTRLERTHARGALNLKRTSTPMSASFWSSRLGGGAGGQGFFQTSQGAQYLGAFRPGERFSISTRQNLERFREAAAGGYDFRSSALSVEGSPAERHRLHVQGKAENRAGRLRMNMEGADGGWTFSGRSSKTESRLGFEQKRVAAQSTTRHSVFVRGEHRLYESLTSGLSGDLEWNRENASRSRSQKLQLQEDYVKTLWGPLRLSLHHDESARWTESSFDSLLNNVLGETLELKDGASVFLGQLAADPDTVMVFSQDRTRRYREGTDYDLVRHGALVEVRRLVTGDIADGEDVAASYQYSASGRRRTRDSARGTRFSLLLGSRGSLWVSENRQSQRLLEASAPGLAPNSESFRERGWGLDLRWKFIGTSQNWREKESDLAPLRSFRSGVRVGGPITQGLSLIGGWTYDSSFFPTSGTRSLGRTWSAEARWSPKPKLELGTEGRLGETSTAELDGHYRSMGARLSWSYRSLEAEIHDRFTWRRVGGSTSQENLIQVRVLRRI